MFLLQIVLPLLWYYPLVETSTYQLPSSSVSANKSFRLFTFIQTTNGDTVQSKYMLEEAYSNDQERTKISYATIASKGVMTNEWLQGAPSEGTLIVDSPAEQPLIISKGSDNRKWCTKISWQTFKRICGIDLIDTFISKKTDAKTIHGPSRILFLLENITDQLEMISKISVTIRNVPSVMFKYTLDALNSIHLFIYYAKSDIQRVGKALPLRISVVEPAGLEIEFDFWSSETRRVIYRSEQIESSHVIEPEHDLEFDEFFIDRAIGCSATTDQQYEHFGSSTPNSFSFQTKTRPLLTDKEDHVETASYVAYDKQLASMRVSRKTEVRDSNLLIDFDLGQTYHALSQTQFGDELMNELLRSNGPEVRDSCVLLSSPKLTSTEYSTSKLLFGANKFRYLGMAKVRGLQAHAYEAYNTTNPVWLEQPISYTRHWFHDQSDKEHLREAYDNLRDGVVLNTVVYLQEKGIPSSTETGNRANLLLVEIYRIMHEEHKIISSISIPVYNFSWQVTQLPGWASTSSIFSLAEQCLISKGSSNGGFALQHPRINVLMSSENSPIEVDGKDDFEWLFSSQSRDISLIDSFHEYLALPSSLVYELTSSLRRSTKSKKVAVDVTFRLATSDESIVKLRYYGTGRAKKLYRFKLHSVEVDLRTCYLLAAHRKSNTFFAHSETTLQCLVDYGSNPIIVSEKLPKVIKPRAFEVFTNGPMEIYYVSHEQLEEDARKGGHSYQGSLMSRLRDLSVLSNSHEAIANSQLMRKLTLTNPRRGENKLSFIVKNFKISHLSDESELGKINENDNDEHDQIEETGFKMSGKMIGFGLVPDLVFSKTFEGESNKDDRIHEEMDLNSCSSACLNSFGCKTYSFCLKGARAECVLTSVNFRTKNLKKQLARIAQNKQLAGDNIHTLNTSEDVGVKVKTQINCELYDKSYLDMFERKPDRQHQIGDNSLILPVAFGGRDECAEMCFGQTLEEISRDNGVVQSVRASLEEGVANFEQFLQDPKALDKITGLQRLSTRSLCREFHYLDSMNLLTLPNDIAEAFKSFKIENLSDSQIKGYCVLPRRFGESHSKHVESQFKTIIKFELFSFRFEILFSKRPALSLLPHKKTQFADDVYRDLIVGTLPKNHQELEQLYTSINSSDNNQAYIMTNYMDERLCAATCVSQAMGPWPACRSFDLTVLPSGFNRTMAMCRLNSITLEDALKAGRKELIDDNIYNTKLQRHYEPKFLALSPSKNFDERDIDNSVRKIERKESSTKICIVVMGLLTGTFIVIFLSWKHSIHIRNESETPILITQTGIDDEIRELPSIDSTINV